MADTAGMLKDLSEALHESPEAAGVALVLAFGALCDHHHLDPQVLTDLAQKLNEELSEYKPTAEA